MCHVATTLFSDLNHYMRKLLIYLYCPFLSEGPSKTFYQQMTIEILYTVRHLNHTNFHLTRQQNPSKSARHCRRITGQHQEGTLVCVESGWVRACQALYQEDVRQTRLACITIVRPSVAGPLVQLGSDYLGRYTVVNYHQIATKKPRRFTEGSWGIGSSTHALHEASDL